jgi:hypothetical protein
MNVVPEPLDNMLRGYSASTCPRMGQIFTQAQTTDDYKQRDTNYKTNFQQKLTDFTGSGKTYDYVTAGFLGDDYLTI